MQYIDGYSQTHLTLGVHIRLVLFHKDIEAAQVSDFRNVVHDRLKVGIVHIVTDQSTNAGQTVRIYACTRSVDTYPLK